ncbi:hypothetical protein AGMMS50268_01170 [Spirochaetia bacterium]|nr:hypothetical protein AGMMS50268_01170 [Spirochaetia bacterium]
MGGPPPLPPKPKYPAGAYVLPVPKGVVKITMGMVKSPPASFKGHLVIPEGIRVIDEGCFAPEFGAEFGAIKNIIELTLPEILKKIDEIAFTAHELRKITIGADVQLVESQWTFTDGDDKASEPIPFTRYAMPEEFQNAYTEIYGSATGTYIKKDDTWEMV